jgi:hypothetical protein
VHHIHPRLSAKFELTSPVNDEVIGGGVKIRTNTLSPHFLEIGKKLLPKVATLTAIHPLSDYGLTKLQTN